MTDPIMQKLDEMQARCDAATPGPWTATFDDADRWTCITGQGHDLGGGLWMVCPEVATCEGEPDGDAEFIATSRTDMPKLIAALRAVLEEHRKALWHTEECTHWPDMDCNCIELGNGDWYEPHIGYFVCETCSGDVTCHGSADHAVEYPCPTVKAIAKALGADDA